MSQIMGFTLKGLDVCYLCILKSFIKLYALNLSHFTNLLIYKDKIWTASLCRIVDDLKRKEEIFLIFENQKCFGQELLQT